VPLPHAQPPVDAAAAAAAQRFLAFQTGKTQAAKKVTALPCGIC
jgi:hypothetical protein